MTMADYVRAADERDRRLHAPIAIGPAKAYSDTVTSAFSRAPVRALRRLYS